MNKPLLSIVVANYNYGRFLDEAIQSVLSQSCNDYELIIVDGGSTDNSVEIIKKYEDKIAWWVSEKDNGQSDAFNKGFAHANGKYLTWLNADDVMLPNAVQVFKETLEKKKNCQWFAGGTVWLSPEGKPFRCVRARSFSKRLVEYGHIPVWGPSSIFSRELFNKTFGFRLNYHYMMDTDLWFRFYYECGESYCVLPGYIWGLRIHPMAKTSGFMFKSSEMNDSNSKGRVAQKRESDDMRSRYPTRPMNILQKAMLYGWHLRPLETLDLWRMRK